jgi:hypothetical protein
MDSTASHKDCCGHFAPKEAQLIITPPRWLRNSHADSASQDPRTDESRAWALPFLGKRPHPGSCFPNYLPKKRLSMPLATSCGRCCSPM